MLFVELNTEMQISGALAFIHNLITILLSILILSKAIKTKNLMLYIFSIFMLFSAAGYYQIGLNYIYWIFTHDIFTYQVKILIGTAGIGIATISWLYIYFKMLIKKKVKFALVAYAIFAIIFYVYLIYFLFIAPGAPILEMIGSNIFPYEVNYTGFVLIAFLGSLIINTITTYHLGIYLIKRSQNRELQWKGKFLVVGMTIIIISVNIDMMIADLIEITIIIRILGIIGILFIYLGFILPNWIRKILHLELKK
ncbi:MAG: hypothetical protein ACFFBT_05340 [Promethearchaeota archaeon]